MDDAVGAYKLYEALNKLPYRGAATRLELLLEPANPQLVNSYLVAIDSALDAISDEFGIGHFPRAENEKRPKVSSPPMKKPAGMKRVLERSDDVVRTMMALLGWIEPICPVLPEFTGDGYSTKCTLEKVPPVEYLPRGLKARIFESIEDVYWLNYFSPLPWISREVIADRVLKISYLFEPEKLARELRPRRPEAYASFLSVALATAEAARKFPIYDESAGPGTQRLNSLTQDLPKRFRYYTDGWGAEDLQPACFGPVGDVSAMVPPGFKLPPLCSGPPFSD